MAVVSRFQAAPNLLQPNTCSGKISLLRYQTFTDDSTKYYFHSISTPFPLFTLVPVFCGRDAAQFIMPGLVTATGVLAFLADEETELKVFALKTLNDDIDTVWTEVAGELSQM